MARYIRARGRVLKTDLDRDGIERPTLIVLNVGFGEQLFKSAKARKPRPCVDCRGTIEIGDLAYSTLNQNTQNRMDRYCVACVTDGQAPDDAEGSKP